MSARVGFVNEETWIFLQNIYDALSDNYETSIYRRPQVNVPLYRNRVSHIAMRRSLDRFMRNCDVGFFEWSSALLKEASQLKTAHSGKLVTRLHRYEMFQWAEQIDWDAVSYAILDTEAMRSKLLGRSTLSHEQTVVIPPVAIEPARIVRESRPFQGNIGILCNVMPRKRVYELILAFHRLATRHPDLKLHIGGPIRPNHRAYHEAMLFLIKQLDLADRVVWHGKVSERWEWYKQMDIFISFSYSEGMQVAPLEAAASGCFCITHHWEGADEIFQPDQLFFTEDEFVDIADNYIRADGREQAQLRAPMTAFVETNCDFDRITNRVRDVIELALA